MSLLEPNGQNAEKLASGKGADKKVANGYVGPNFASGIYVDELYANQTT